MSALTRTITRTKTSILFVPSGMINALHNLQGKIDVAAGAATALEMRLRIVAELVQEVQDELRKRTKESYHEAKLYYLIPAILEVFQDHLTDIERQHIESCRPPRNKLTHASFVEFMLEINGEAPGRVIDRRTMKGRPLKKENLLEGAISLDHSGALENFTRKAQQATSIVEEKIMRALS
jgi:hypothetical protein